jgi:drug/metabolite transporter (DMT)-like permease
VQNMTKADSNALRTVLPFALVFLIWGLNYPFVSLGLAYSPPIWLAFFRALLGFFAAAVLLFAMRTAGSLTTRQKIIALLLGVPGSAVFLGFWFMGETLVPPGLTSVLIYTFPLWIMFISIPVLGERPRPLRIGAALLGFFGVALAEQIGLVNMSSDLTALVELAIAGFLFAFLNVGFKRFFKGDELLRANVYQLGGSLLPLVVWAEFASPFQAVRWNPELLAVLLWLGIIGTAVSFVAWFWLLSRHSASSMGAYAFTAVVVALASSFIIFGERVNLIQAAGVLAIMVSIYLVNRTERIVRPS